MNATTVKRNEILLRDHTHWLHFANAHQILIADRLEDVLPLLQEIERLVQEKNWYAAGFLSYEAAPAFDSALWTQPETGFPYLWFGLYPRPNIAALPSPERSRPILDWQPTVDRETYSLAIAKIKNLIAAGQTYQVNYTLRLQANASVSPWDLFLYLAETQNKHAAYVDTGQYVICSASPELFFERNGDQLLCRPMKGTAPRGRTTQEDEQRSDWLRNSEKNRAENVMIVDMIRNDLGRIAETGSICVPQLFEAERYPTLWQMTSTITAQTDRSVTDIFTALFPCASITGAPKVSTMKIIAELEGTPRRIYTGAIGYIAPKQKAKFSVAIRTILIDRERQQAEYGVGGGIVWDSSSADEYDEALLKARLLTEQQPLFSLLETMLWTPDRGFFLYEKHIARLIDSANYFDIPITKEKLEEYLQQISSSFYAPQRVRVLLDRAGNLESTSQPVELDEQFKPLRVCLAKQPLDPNNVFLFHKTTQRAIYESAREGCEGFDDVLLYNTSGELTEFTIGNLVVELDARLFTPPLSCGVLPGTFRAHLVETGQIVERTISVSQLKDCTQIFRINSVRKWQRVKIERNLSS